MREGNRLSLCSPVLLERFAGVPEARQVAGSFWGVGVYYGTAPYGRTINYTKD